MQAVTPLPDVRPWKSLYTAALFEIDGSKLLERIARAEAALIVLARELFHASGDNIEKEEALDDAMYALRALRNTYQCPRTAVQSNRAAA
ncbi:MAG: hypothetical protein WCC32_13955 [Terriglobales bacterium]